MEVPSIEQAVVPSDKPYNHVAAIPSSAYESACEETAMRLPTRALLQASKIEDFTNDIEQPHLLSSAGLTDEERADVIDDYEDRWIDYWLQVMDITDAERVIFEQFLNNF